MPVTPPAPPRIFNRHALRLHRDRAARRWATHDFLVREATERLLERLGDIRRNFPRVLDLGCHGGELAALLPAAHGTELVVQADLSPAMAQHAQESNGRATLVADEELLPFAPASFDLVISTLNLHWVNDLPGALAQIRRILKPDGLLLASFFGAGTLGELRMALTEAEIAVRGGVGARIIPFAEIRDAGGLLQRAGFALPIVDNETIAARYGDALTLMRDLRGMGESSALEARTRHFTPRRLFTEAAQRYAAQYAGEDFIPASFQIITLTAWAPHPAQPKPLAPGSAEHSLAEALKDRDPS